MTQVIYHKSEIFGIGSIFVTHIALKKGARVQMVGTEGAKEEGTIKAINLNKLLVEINGNLMQCHKFTNWDRKMSSASGWLDWVVSKAAL